MNKGNRKPRGQIGLCPKCHRYSGERRTSVNVPERYFVWCSSCGYIVGGHTQSAATAKWNKQSHEAGH